MIQPQPQKAKKSLIERLPRLGRLSQLLLLVGIFSIAIIALWAVYQQQVPKRGELERTLASLQQTLAGAPKQVTSKDTLMAQLRSIEAQTEAARSVFYTPSQGPEIMDKLLKIARAYNLSITRTEQSTSVQTMVIGADKITLEVLAFSLQLKGQVPDFQNFLLDVGNKLPTSQITGVTITVADKVGEQDSATIKIDVFCYGNK